MSFNNYTDADAALRAAYDHNHPCVAIIKHANPCGVAEGANLLEAYEKALRCDPTSAFGGIVALNRTLDAEAAKAITEIFTEVIIAPDATPEAIAIVGAKKNLRLLLAGGLPDPRAKGLAFRSVAGGFLAQSRDKVIFVINKIDLLDESEREEALGYARTQLAKLVPSPKVFAVSAEKALGGDREGAGLNALVNELTKFLAEDRGRVLLDNALDEGLRTAATLRRGIEVQKQAVERLNRLFGSGSV